MKLHLGCGSNLKTGQDWINCDVRIPEYKFVGAHCVECSASELLHHFQDGYFDGILCEFVLEHLPPDEVKETLYRCWRLLREEGVLEVTVPDHKGILNAFDDIMYESSLGNIQTSHLMDLRLVCHRIFGDDAVSPHRSIWTRHSAEHFLLGEGLFTLEKVNYEMSGDHPMTFHLRRKS
jgi:predicted SAM-dependent methyltransferase